jgi:diguanylate cyclase (GGDEF)-like protein/PAS domain S-box-containing protein
MHRDYLLDVRHDPPTRIPENSSAAGKQRVTNLRNPRAGIQIPNFFALSTIQKGRRPQQRVLCVSNSKEALDASAQLADQTGDVPAAPVDASILRSVMDRLPLSVTVQNADGRFLFVNDKAAAHLAMDADSLIGRSPTDFLPAPDAKSRREWELSLLDQGDPITGEETVPDQGFERIWRVTHTPIQHGDQKLLLSSSIDITEFKQTERELAESAHIDKLTGLPDRVLMHWHVDSIIRQDNGTSRFALAFIDLDNFKHINDYYSHAVGDALLVKMGERISKTLRPGDMLARIGGDEFVLIVAQVESDEQVKALIAEKVSAFRQPFQIEDFEVFGSCSIGISIYPDHGRAYETLRRNADSAMYQAKRGSKGGVVLFDPAIGHAAVARMEAEQRLRLAIRDRKFCCAFQPKVDIKTQEVVGFEALVRWRDENGELHSPGEFIGLAIELGLINSVAQFVLEQTLASIEQLDALFGPDVSISINIAAKQACDLEFMTDFAKALRESGHANRFMIELTEEAFLAKGEFQTCILPVFREIGVKISIDDFGTGYSSLSALAEIVADELKIDRSFISSIHERPRNQSILRAIESIGHALGMSIVAEGVETHEELAYLHAATRIRLAQGFYFAKPIYLDASSTQSARASGPLQSRAFQAGKAAAPRVLTRRDPLYRRRGFGKG